ncbi:MAG: restriction endonuclease subunit S [Chlamydiota bacterium]
MIADLKPYPAMKDSGLPWLGEVPGHWHFRRTKTLLRERVGKGFPDEPLLAATQTKGVVRKDQYENRTVLALKDLHLLKLVRIGDFVISLRSFQGGIEFAREQGIISPAYTVLYPTDPGTHGFLAWLFKSKPYVENLSLYVTGIRQGQNIDYEKISRSAIPLPPLPEQAAIVHFLDHADRRIRRYISAKQKLIKLLEEQKQAIIHHAVTRGLNPNVRLKPSGVEWLGDVPEHWELRRLRNMAQVLVSNVDKHTNANESPVRLCNYVDVYKNERITEGLSFMRATASPVELERFRLQAGDVIITKDSEEWNDIGVPALVEHSAPDLVCGYHLAILRPRNGVALGEYMLRALKSRGVASQFYVSANGVTRYGLSHGAIKSAFLPVPPLPEQSVIVRFLNEATANIITTIDRAQREITLLREYRIRLIADVVTGKIDVREAAARLPEAIEEPEALDDTDAPAEGDEDNAAGDLDTALEETAT